MFKASQDDNINDYIRSFTRINYWTDGFALNYVKCRFGGFAADWLQRYEAYAANDQRKLDQFLDDLKSNMRARSDSHVAECELLYERFQKKGRQPQLTMYALKLTREATKPSLVYLIFKRV